MSLNGKRILIGKPGLDGHDAGAKVIAMALRNAGAEVIYTGLRKSPEFIVRSALEEDVDALGLSVLSGSHHELLEDTLAELAKHEATDIPVFIGGTIPTDDRAPLKNLGAVGVFTAEDPLEEVVAEIARILK